MLITGKRLRDDTNIQANTIYIVDNGFEVKHEEPQQDGSKDVIEIKYNTNNHQYGIYAKEYRPAHVPKKGHKAADLLLMAIDESAKEFSAWILDIKVTVGGDEVIFHLIDQWKDSMLHKDNIAMYLKSSGLKETLHIGYITRELQKERIYNSIQERKREIDKLDEELKKMPVTTAVISKMRSLDVKKLEFDVLERFYNNEVVLQDQLLNIESYFLVQKQKDEYRLQLNIQCS